ncbi:hypothetical protein [Embleya sp. NPDC059259]|uniref:hypothetical protein n=1 Tax=unclassified Embleya TaxID=2699296 RepID=UPI00369CB48C
MTNVDPDTVRDAETDTDTDTDTDTRLPVVALPAWSVRLTPCGPGVWRVDFFSLGTHPVEDEPDQATVHLTDVEAGDFAHTLLRPGHPDEATPGRARLVRDGFGLRLRVLVAPAHGEAGVIAHVQEHHRLVLLHHLARHRPDLIPIVTPPDPRLCLGPIPITGLTIDQAAELHTRLAHWLASEGLRAAIADRDVIHRLTPTTTA